MSYLDHWNVRTSGTSASLQAIAWGNAIFVAVGENGTVLTSGNGVNWTACDVGTRQLLTGIAYGNETFVITGEGGKIFTSHDGVEWKTAISCTNGDLLAITFGQGLFVAVGCNGLILTSNDAVDWSHQVSAVDADLRGITHGDGRFVALAEKKGTIATAISSNGLDWVYYEHAMPSVLALGITFGNRWVAVGISESVEASSDGVLWSSFPAGGYWLEKVTYGCNQFAAIGIYGQIVTSEDGFNWIRRANPATSTLHGIEFGQDTFVAVGEEGLVIQSDPVNSAYYLGKGQHSLHKALRVCCKRGYLISVATNGPSIRGKVVKVRHRYTVLVDAAGLHHAIPLDKIIEIR